MVCHQDLSDRREYDSFDSVYVTLGPLAIGICRYVAILRRIFF